MFEHFELTSFATGVILVAVIELYTKKTIFDSTEKWPIYMPTALGILAFLMCMRLLNDFGDNLDEIPFTVLMLIYIYGLFAHHKNKLKEKEKEKENFIDNHS